MAEKLINIALVEMKDGDKSVKSLNVLDKYLKRFEKNLL